MVSEWPRTTQWVSARPQHQQLPLPATVPTVPGAPTGIGAIPGNGQVILSWIAPNNNGGAAIDYYLIFVNGIVLTDHYPSTTAMITGLINDQEYSIAIAAHNTVGASVQSSTITATPSATTKVPGVPLGLAAISGERPGDTDLGRPDQ